MKKRDFSNPFWIIQYKICATKAWEISWSKIYAVLPFPFSNDLNKIYEKY